MVEGGVQVRPWGVWSRHWREIGASVVNGRLRLVGIDWRLVWARLHWNVWPRRSNPRWAGVHLVHLSVRSRGDSGGDGVRVQADVRGNRIRGMAAHMLVHWQMITRVMARHQIVTQALMRHVFASVKSSDGLFAVVGEQGPVVRVLARMDVLVRKKAEDVIRDNVDALFVPTENKSLREAAAGVGVGKHEAVDAYQYSHRIGKGLVVDSFYNDFTVFPMRAHT